MQSPASIQANLDRMNPMQRAAAKRAVGGLAIQALRVTETGRGAVRVVVTMDGMVTRLNLGPRGKLIERVILGPDFEA